MKVDGTETVTIEAGTEVVPARGYQGQSAVAVRFLHNANSSAVLGLTTSQALELAEQLVKAVRTR